MYGALRTVCAVASPRLHYGMKTKSIALPLLIAASFFLLSPVAFAATAGFEISGWIPYWRSQKGVESVLPNLGSFTEINPFMYTVKLNGGLNSVSSLSDEEWVRLRAGAKEKGVRFIPTVMWANSDAIDDVLRDPAKRREHVRAIAAEVYTQRLDGIDVDYEGKYARTRTYFSLFLKELHEAIGYDKWVMCTVEARTPLGSRYETPEDVPTDIEYANDFAEINKYCDRVRIMAYDQGRIDVKLNAANQHPYVPVADVAWVEKVMRLAMQDISPSKLVIGIPTYGYEYDMFLDLSGETEYSRLWTFNPGYAAEVSQKVGAEPSRNSAGELFLIYPASQSPDPAIPLPNATRVMSWSDAEAIRAKAKLAKDLGLRGIAVFKIDGGQDPGLWNVLAAYDEDAPGGKIAAIPAGAGSGPLGSDPLSVPARDLKFGMRHEDVRALQRLLNATGYTVTASGGGSPGNETAYFGPATRAALIKFQREHKITPAAGYFGPKTRAVFLSLR